MPASDSKLKKLKELTEQDLDLVNWALPEVEDEIKDNSGKTTAFGKPLDWYYANQTDELDADGQDEEELQPLTAEEIEEIRQAAYDEGILQGHNDGFEKGHAEGVEQGHAEGLQKGREEGYQSGLEEGKEVIEQMAEHWQSLLEQLNNPLHELNDQAEKQLVELAVYLAEAIVGVEVKTNRDAIVHTLKESIEALPMADATCEIKLHPEDFELVSSRFSEKEIADKGWHLSVDPSIEQGGCLVESRTSSIDRTLSSRVRSTLDRFLQDADIVESSDE